MSCFICLDRERTLAVAEEHDEDGKRAEDLVEKVKLLRSILSVHYSRVTDYEGLIPTLEVRVGTNTVAYRAQDAFLALIVLSITTGARIRRRMLCDAILSRSLPPLEPGSRVMHALQPRQPCCMKHEAKRQQCSLACFMSW